MSEKKRKNPFVEGPIAPEFIAQLIAKHNTQLDAGAHSIFLGQVRADEIDGKRVRAIEYTAYPEMALETYYHIREAIFAKYPLNCLHVHQSLGTIKAGEICLLVMTTSQHRAAAIAACSEMVELVKKELQVWGKELFEDDTHQWKTNQ